MNERLPAALEAAALLRSAQSGGGFGTLVRRGDEHRGDLIVHVVERGFDVALLQRRMAADFSYRWERLAVPAQGMTRFCAAQAQLDPDFWLIELDIPDAERFIAEMTSSA